MRRHPEISLRKGESMSSQRLRGADPFVIKQWYQSLDRIHQTERIFATDGHLVYNCDETVFGHDPKDVLLVAPKGQKRVSKNIAGSGKRIQLGKYVWQSWIPEEDYPGTMYTAQHEEWMKGGLFFKWFKESFLPFIKSTEERGGKYVILIFDGASVHTSYPLSKCAIDNGVILLKLPANVSHYMQPLDKCVFKPIKTIWNKEMVDFNGTFPGRILPNGDFSKRIKSVWEGAFKSEYLISGFRSTGLFPRFKSSTDIENVPNQQEQVKHQNPEPPVIEDFIRTKLTENLAKKAPEKKQRKRVSNKVGDVLTSAKAMKILKKKYDQESNRNTTDVPSSSGEQAQSEFEVESEVAVSEKEDSTDEEETSAFQNKTRDKINIEIGDFVEVNFTYNPNTKKEIAKTFVARVLDSNCRNKFELEEDTENFIQYQIMSKQQGVPVTLRLRKGVLPHKFQCQKENKPIPVRQAALKRQRLSFTSCYQRSYYRNQTMWRLCRYNNHQ
ncbi:hypothetical protein JTB14_035262 [Gonioctena quinquepunctata]|nr:hypothetical protein JTB14_035262 [Gonioctena quinquepunctata]